MFGLGGLSTKLIIAGVVLAVLGGVGLYIKSIIDDNAINPAPTSDGSHFGESPTATQAPRPMMAARM